MNYRRSPRVLTRTVGRELILATPDGEDFDCLSETGGDVWELLAEPRTAAEVAAALGAAYGQPPGAIRADVENLLGSLLCRGLVEIVEDPARETSG